jgi:hypothetical protein
MADICVVYLVRAQNGIEPFMRFLESYRHNPGGIEHDFLIIFKGFERPGDKDSYLKHLESFQYLSFDVPDIGFDINAYFNVAQYYEGKYKYFCFLNSFSVIQCVDWLSKFYKCITLPMVGLVGATGSWQSHNAWGRIIQSRKMRVRGFLVSNEKLPFVQIDRSVSLALINRKWRSFCRHLYLALLFPAFPNYHLRSNAFMVSSEMIKKLELPDIRTKIDAYKFESGKNGLTRQILGMGYRALVVGKDGVGYKIKLWNTSKTFWQSDQENLMIADNQTLSYQNGSIAQRRFLSFMAWGIMTRPKK